MNSILRLLTITTLAAGMATALAGQAGLGPSFKGPVGLQLYSLRNQFAKDVPGSLDQVKNFGFKYVELAGTYNLPPEKYVEMLKARGLKPVAGHFGYDRYQTDPEGVAREAKALGLKYAGCAWIPREGPFTEKKCREAIEVFNRAGKVLAKHKIKFFYHQHGYEFQPYGQETLMDLMIKETDPKYVAFEMDVFWIAHPGQDPAAWLKKYGKRWELIHLKDMKKGTKTGELTGQSDVNNDVAMGTGQLDWQSILPAAKQAGVKYYFIEDESDSVLQQIPVTLLFLEQVKF